MSSRECPRCPECNTPLVCVDDDLDKLETELDRLKAHLAERDRLKGRPPARRDLDSPGHAEEGEMSDLCVWCQKLEPPEDYLELKPSKQREFCSCEWDLDGDAQESIVITLRARAERAEAERDRLLPLARFAAEILDDTLFPNYDADVFEAADKSGLITKRVEPCTDENCDCEGEPGECWVYAPGVEETLAELRKGEG